MDERDITCFQSEELEHELEHTSDETDGISIC